jgi:VanZ family protein
MPRNKTVSPQTVIRIQQSIFWGWLFSLGLILYGSLSPEVQIKTQIENSDKILHAAAYTWLALGARISFIPPSFSVRLGIGLIFLGCAVEFVQSLIPGRFFSGADMLANALGVGLGLALAALISRKDTRFLGPFIK